MNLILNLEIMRDAFKIAHPMLIHQQEQNDEAIETVRAMQEALYKLEEAAQDSNEAQYGTLSTRFVLDLIQPALRRAEGNAG